MKRKLSEIISFNALSHLRYLPAAILTVRNWPLLLLNYTGIKDKGETYYLRNGLHIKTGDGTGASILFVIFLKKEYGSIPPSHSLVIDIGAHVGIYSLYASQPLGTKVYAFEPVPENFSLLQENIEQNSLRQRILAFPLAVASNSGHMRIYLRRNASGLHSLLPALNATFQLTYEKEKFDETFIDVPCVSLRDIFERNDIQHCDALKIDCEGAEYDILYALPKSYFERIQSIHIEYHNQSQQEHTGKALLSFLEQQGFHIQKNIDLGHQGTALLTR